MAKLNLDTENTNLGVTVGESDEYTELVHLVFDRHIIPEDMNSKYDLFLTLHQFEVIAKFMLEEAEKIRNIQESR